MRTELKATHTLKKKISRHAAAIKHTCQDFLPLSLSPCSSIVYPSPQQRLSGDTEETKKGEEEILRADLNKTEFDIPARLSSSTLCYSFNAQKERDGGRKRKRDAVIERERNYSPAEQDQSSREWGVMMPAGMRADTDKQTNTVQHRPGVQRTIQVRAQEREVRETLTNQQNWAYEEVMRLEIHTGHILKDKLVMWYKVKTISR